ncbi:MAG: LysM peptidoglycan-binding domain-containing protein [Tepidisphaeraceae bacterium]
MKLAIGLMGLALLGVVGCQSDNTSKPSADASTLDLTAPPAAPTQEAYAPPVETAAPDPAAVSTPNMSAAPITGGSYTVKPGDTLWKIAATHYGDGHKWKQIVDANPGLEPSKLKIGQTITLP